MFHTILISILLYNQITILGLTIFPWKRIFLSFSDNFIRNTINGWLTKNIFGNRSINGTSFIPKNQKE